MFVLSGCRCQMIFFVRKWICRQAVSSTRNSSIPRLYEIKKSSGRLGSVCCWTDSANALMQPGFSFGKVLAKQQVLFTSKMGYIDVLFTSKSLEPWLWFMITKLHFIYIHTCMRECFIAFLEGLLSQSQAVLFPMMSYWSEMLRHITQQFGPPLIRPRQRRNVRCGNSRNWRKEEMKRDRPNMAKPLTIEPWEIKASHVYARKHCIAHCNAALRSHWNEKNVAHTSRTWWMDIVGFYSVSMPATCQVEELRKQMYLSGGKLSCEKHEDHRKCRNRRTSNWKGLLKLPLDCSILGGRSRQASKKPMRLQF